MCHGVCESFKVAVYKMNRMFVIIDEQGRQEFDQDIDDTSQIYTKIDNLFGAIFLLRTIQE